MSRRSIFIALGVVLVAAVAALHEVRVVHADLKPANAYLIVDPTLGSGAPSTLQKSLYWRSLPVASMMWPSAAGNT